MRTRDIGAERKGWVKFQREWLNHPILNKDADYLSVWTHLVANAAIEPTPALFGGRLITLQAGQLTTGRKQLSQMSGVQEKKVYRILSAFKYGQLIEQQTSSKNTLISVLPAAFTQEYGQQSEQQMGNKWAADGQQMGTLEEKRIENKESKEDNPRAGHFTPPTVEEVRAYCCERKNSISPERFFDFYSANGWVQGKGKPIKDWKAAVRTWERRDDTKRGDDCGEKEYY